MTSYPIDAILLKLKEAVRSSPSLVLHAPPGAGKTTRVPLALLDVIGPEQGRIIMLEPRRIAAVSAARWMARTLNEQVGETIGYSIRFDTKRSDRTRIEVVTEGVLTRRIQADPGLEGTALVIFDEFHERSIHADLALALCLDVRTQLRPDLKILVMSATMDPGPIASLLGNAQVIASAGKAWPVEERYLDTGAGPLPGRMAAAVRTALRDTVGDILAFLPGSGEIRAVARELHGTPDLDENRVALHALYGDLPFEEQERAIMPSQDQRKVVLATNIAETSLTIEGVHVVVDSGLSRMLRHDPATGMNRLVTVPVSRASAEQRKGRAGRLGPGVCYRLYSRQDLSGMQAFTLPEILVSDLSPLALELAAWGVKDPAALSWLDAVPAAAWGAAVSLLRELGALDQTGSITAIGQAMARLPLHPRLSRLMLRAQELGCAGLGADLAALLSERDLVRRGPADPSGSEPDLSERIDVLRRWRRTKDAGAGIDPAALRNADRASQQLQRLLIASKGASHEPPVDQRLVARLALSAYPDRIGRQREQGSRNFVLSQGRGVCVSSRSLLVNSPFLVAMHVDAGEKAEGIVYIAEGITEDLIRKECPGRIRKVRRTEWDRDTGRIIAAEEERLDTLLLSSRSFTPSDEESAALLCEAIRTTPGLLVFSKEALQLQARAMLVKKAFPEESWPDLSEEELRTRPEAWLPPWLGGIRSMQALGRLNILPALKATLSREQQRLLDERAPLALTVPSKSRIMLDYSTGVPVLAVKLQELFGLADTPMLANNRVKVLLHLLSPARRPVQVTQDLKGFWNSGYQQVKKELKGRYPKHPWPDDPWNAAPTRRTKPRGE